MLECLGQRGAMAVKSNKNEKKQQTLEKLVDELMKDQPNKTLVRQLSLQLGIPYSGDSMTQINTVLQKMDTYFEKGSMPKSKILES